LSTAKFKAAPVAVPAVFPSGYVYAATALNNALPSAVKYDNKVGWLLKSIAAAFTTPKSRRSMRWSTNC